jgi:signal transduction histidine kinase
MRRRFQSWLAGETHPSPLAGFAVAAGAVAGCTLLIYPLKSGTDPLSLDVLYVPAILLVAAGWGARMGVLTTLASLLAFDFFHVPPTLEVTLGSEAGPLIAFAIAALAATFVAALTARVRVAEERERARAESRARLVAAADEERRRVVRDLHDGAQQRLVHAVITLKLARRALDEGASDAEQLVGEGLAHAEQANAELRELAHGILPSVLTRGGLRAGVESLTSRVSIPVAVDVCEERFPPAIEATAYFVISEALTNAVKHSGARGAEVSARLEDGALRVEVRDDGVGGARLDRGSGLLGLRDRLDALDGRLLIESPPGRGTLLGALVPVPGQAESRR